MRGNSKKGAAISQIHVEEVDNNSAKKGEDVRGSGEPVKRECQKVLVGYHSRSPRFRPFVVLCVP